MFASEHNVRGIPLDAESTGYLTDAMTPVVGVGSTFVAVEFDADEQYVYYSDVRKDVIARVKTDGTGENCGEFFVGGGGGYLRIVDTSVVRWHKRFDVNMFPWRQSARIVWLVRNVFPGIHLFVHPQRIDPSGMDAIGGAIGICKT